MQREKVRGCLEQRRGQREARSCKIRNAPNVVPKGQNRVNGRGRFEVIGIRMAFYLFFSARPEDEGISGSTSMLAMMYWMRSAGHVLLVEAGPERRMSKSNKEAVEA